MLCGSATLRQYNFSARLMTLERAIAKGHSGCPAVCNTRQPRLSGSRYRKTFAPYDVAMFLR